MKTKHKRIADRLSANVLIITSLLILLTLVIVAVGVFKNLNRRAESDAAQDLHTEVLKIEKALVEAEATAANVAWLISESREDVDKLRKITRQALMSNKYITAVSVSFCPYAFKEDVKYFAPYSIRNSAVPDAVFTYQYGDVNYDYPTMDWFQIPQILGEPYWSDPYFDQNNTDLQLITYGYPIKDENGEVYAILSVDIELPELIGLVNEIKPYPNSNTLLVAKNGSFIYHPDKSKIMNSTIFSEPLETGDPRWMKLAKGMMTGKEGLSVIKNGRKYFLVAYAPLLNGWSMALVSQYKDIYKDTMKMFDFLLIVTILSLLLLYFITKRIILLQTQPITEFTFAALTMAKGNFHSMIPEVTTEDEMLKLHDSLEYMQKSVSSYIKELKSTTASNERYASELDIARNIQINMLPNYLINDERVGLYATMHPAKEVGGDLYDYVVRGDYLYFLVGDVSGKGVPAALVMAITRAMFRFITGQNLSIEQIVGKVNNILSEGNKSTMFVTLFAGKLNLLTGELSFCNGGHNPIVVKDPGGKAGFLKAKPNIACGLFEDFPYQSETLQLRKGTSLLVYTDGVTEAEKVDKSQYGEERLLAWMNGIDAEVPEERVENVREKAAVESLLADVRAFTEGNEQNDDITAMAITFK